MSMCPLPTEKKSDRPEGIPEDAFLVYDRRHCCFEWRRPSAKTENRDDELYEKYAARAQRVEASKAERVEARAPSLGEALAHAVRRQSRKTDFRMPSPINGALAELQKQVDDIAKQIHRLTNKVA